LLHEENLRVRERKNVVMRGKQKKKRKQEIFHVKFYRQNKVVNANDFYSKRREEKNELLFPILKKRQRKRERIMKKKTE
jgi:hypothetical protein